MGIGQSLCKPVVQCNGPLFYDQTCTGQGGYCKWGKKGRKDTLYCRPCCFQRCNWGSDCNGGNFPVKYHYNGFGGYHYCYPKKSNGVICNEDDDCISGQCKSQRWWDVICHLGGNCKYGASEDTIEGGLGH